MYDRIEDRINAIDNRIRKHASMLFASGLYEEPSDPTVASQRNVFAVGMICCDGEGHLNEKSILLQSRLWILFRLYLLLLFLLMLPLLLWSTLPRAVLLMCHGPRF